MILVESTSTARNTSCPGRFRQLIYPVADLVGVAHDREYANNLLFDDAAGGAYAGFDDQELTAWSGGKARVMAHLQGVHGDPLVAPWMRAWPIKRYYGCVNNPDYLKIAFDFASL